MKGPNESHRLGSDTWHPHIQASHPYSYMECENIARHRKGGTGGQHIPSGYTWGVRDALDRG